MKERCFGYCRVSTGRQEAEGASLEAQKAKIAEYARQKGLGEPAFFVDVESAHKGKLVDREAGGALLAILRPGDHIVVTKFDRAFRIFSDFVHHFENWIAQDIAFHVLDFGGNTIDPRTSIGRLVFRVLATMAELESDIRSDRIKSVNDFRKSQGLYANPNYVPLGFKGEPVKGGGFRAVPDVPTRNLMGQMLEWHQSGRSYDQIRHHLDRSKIISPRRPNKKDKTQRWWIETVKTWIKTEIQLRAKERGEIA